MATIRNLIVRISVTENTDKGIRKVTASLRETNREIDKTNKNASQFSGIIGNLKTSRELDSGNKSANRFSGTLSKLGKTSLSGLTRGLSAVAKGTKTAAIGITAVAAAAASLNTAIQAGAGLAPLAGGLLLLPAAALSAATALGTLRLATSGMDKAFKAAISGAPADKLAAALKDLAPAARNVMVELAHLRPSLLGIRNAAQQALFAPLQGQLTALVKTLAGPLTAGVAAVATQFGLAGRQVAAFARESKSVELLRAAFGQTQVAISILRTALTPLLAGFRALAGEGLSFLPRIATAVATIATRFGEWLSKIVETGQATQWINNFFATLTQLGGVLKSVGGILSSVFSAASAAGSGFLGVLGAALSKLNEFLKTSAGRSALVGIFQGLAAAGEALGPVIAALVIGLGTLAGPVGRLAQVLGPILTDAINALAPALAALEPGIRAIFAGLGAAVQVLAPVLPQLAGAISQIAVALAPVLPLVAQAIVALAPLLPLAAALAGLLAQQLSAALLELTAVLGPVISAVAGALVPVIPQITAAFGLWARALIPVAGLLGQQLGQALARVLPQFAAMIPQLLNGLVPAMIRLLVAITPLLPQIIQLGLVIAENLAQSLPELLPSLIQLIDLMTQWTPIMVPVLSMILQISTALAGSLGTSVAIAVGAVSAGLSAILGVFQWLFDLLLGHSIIPDIANGIVRWFGALPGRVIGFFSDMARGAVGKVGDMLRSLSGVPGAISKIFSGAGSWLYGIGRDIIVGLWNGLVSLSTWLYNRLVGLVRAIIPAPVRWALGISSPSKVMAELGRFAGLGLAAGLVGTAPRVRDAAGTLAKAAVPALASPAGIGAGARAPAGVAAAGQAGGGAGGDVRVWFDFAAGNGELKKVMQKIVRVDGGGDVQVALGGT